jgi:hypothetical protein
MQMNFIGDIVERETPDTAPDPPDVRNQPPIVTRKSKWKQRRENTCREQKGSPPQTTVAGKLESATGTGLSEMEKVHLENIERMAKMSPEEIVKEREELINSLDPGVLQALLARAEKAESSIDPGTQSWGPWNANAPVIHPEGDPEFDEFPVMATNADYIQDRTNDSNIEKVAERSEPRQQRNVHFLKPVEPQPAEAGESSSDFLQKLHEKYFPSLPVETDKLAWMQPMNDNELNEYSSTAESLSPGELRFDFKGNLISPRLSLAIDPSMGLHHHGDAPAAAGYTIPELAHLSRSTVASQRCIAIQTLGRVLYKLNNNQYGDEITAALSPLVKMCRILDSLTQAADENQTRSVNVRAYATDALWLYHSSKQPARAV